MTQKYDYDLITIGAGSGGVRASRIAASLGAKVATIEEDKPGGTCVLRGCVPKKILVMASQFATDCQDAVGFGWSEVKAQHNWQKLINRKDAELERLAEIYANLLETANVDLIHGHATLTSPNEVQVGDKTLTAKNILIATGSTPHLPDIENLSSHAITSNEALSLPELPKRIVIFGAGYIAVEFAGIFNSLGAEVHMVYRAPLPLRGFDMSLREKLADAMQARKIILHPNSLISSVDGDKNQKQIVLDSGKTLTAETLMVATGRKPLVDNLGLDEVGVKTDKSGAILVNDKSQSSIDSIYAIGDVTNRVNLTPVAIAEGHALADALFGKQPHKTLNYSQVPSAVFSQPPIATIGMSEDSAIEEGREVKIYETSFTPMKNTIAARDEKTLIKLIVDAKSDKVIGAHMLGSDAPEIMQGIAAAISAGITKTQLDSTIGIHPTSAEEFVLMRDARSPNKE